ncbi:MAG: winged helix-turn-helix domain-containing protein [Crocosphaera sp.]|nr:winged helix-turn-helix domain-containing protein [Crocosphaera sp.]
MSEIVDCQVSPQRGWEYLKGMEYCLRIPRPENKQADLIEQEAWKKNSL